MASWAATPASGIAAVTLITITPGRGWVQSRHHQQVNSPAVPTSMSVVGSAATTGTATPGAVPTATAVPVSRGAAPKTGPAAISSAHCRMCRRKEEKMCSAAGRAVAAGFGSVATSTPVSVAEAAVAVAPSAVPQSYQGGKERPGLWRRVWPSLWIRQPWEGSPSRDGKPSNFRLECLDGGLQHRMCRQYRQQGWRHRQSCRQLQHHTYHGRLRRHRHGGEPRHLHLCPRTGRQPRPPARLHRCPRKNLLSLPACAVYD